MGRRKNDEDREFVELNVRWKVPKGTLIEDVVRWLNKQDIEFRRTETYRALRLLLGPFALQGLQRDSKEILWCIFQTIQQLESAASDLRILAYTIDPNVLELMGVSSSRDRGGATYGDQTPRPLPDREENGSEPKREGGLFSQEDDDCLGDYNIEEAEEEDEFDFFVRGTNND